MSVGPAGSALFDAFTRPIGVSPWPDLVMMFDDRPLCRVLTPLDGAYDPEADGVDLIYALPAGGPSLIPNGVMGHLVAAVDSGAAIALHATDDDAITAAIDSILAMSGGGQ